MRRLDHSMIFVFIAGTYTPFAPLDMPPSTGHLVLAIVWGGTLAGIALALFWPGAPRWLGVALYLLLGWVAVWYAGLILHNAGLAAAVLLAVGGALYSIGAVFYALRWPDPWPTTSVITSYFTRAPPSQRFASSSRSGSRCSRTSTFSAPSQRPVPRLELPCGRGVRR